MTSTAVGTICELAGNSTHRASLGRCSSEHVDRAMTATIQIGEGVLELGGDALRIGAGRANVRLDARAEHVLGFVGRQVADECLEVRNSVSLREEHVHR